jgi:hypothetical protein
MAIKKTRTGRYQIDFRDMSGHRHREAFDTKREADAALAKIKSAINQGQYIAPRSVPAFAEAPEQ